MQADRKEKPNTSIKTQINHLVLIDREVDYVTPLLTQQVYTGILDDWFTIDCGQGKDLRLAKIITIALKVLSI